MWRVLLVLTMASCKPAPDGALRTASPSPPPSGGPAPSVASPSPAAPAPTAAPAPVAAPRTCSTAFGSARAQGIDVKVTGSLVPARPIAVDGSCPALISTGYGREEEQQAMELPDGFDIVTSEAAFRQAFHCAPPTDVDFNRERLAVWRFHHQTPESARLDSAVADHGRIRIVISTSRARQGIAPVEHRSVEAFALPAGTQPVELVFCSEPGPADTGMER